MQDIKPENMVFVNRVTWHHRRTSGAFSMVARTRAEWDGGEVRWKNSVGGEVRSSRILRVAVLIILWEPKSQKRV